MMYGSLKFGEVSHIVLRSREEDGEPLTGRPLAVASTARALVRLWQAYARVLPVSMKDTKRRHLLLLPVMGRPTGGQHPSRDSGSVVGGGVTTTQGIREY